MEVVVHLMMMMMKRTGDYPFNSRIHALTTRSNRNCN